VAELRILFEDNHLIAVNKPCSELVQSDRTGDPCLADRVKAFIKDRDAKPGNVFLGVIHRLDRPTSGVVLFAKTDKGLSRMNELFRRGEVRKSYWAVVDVSPPTPEGVVTHYLVRNARRNKSYAYDTPRGDSKTATLSWRLLAASDRYYLLELVPETGRHHQIRTQLYRLGCHIKGDLKYGARRSNPGGGIHLHARALRFAHPVHGKEVAIYADPPPEDDLWRVFLGMSGVAESGRR
jgi:23S rRNA pseudouridine1911/1915/1917 synthase